MHPILLSALILILPFLGTAIGSGTVFFFKKSVSKTADKILYGFAAGVMTASSVWSLLLPALELSDGVFEVAGGLFLGMAFFIVCDIISKTYNKAPFFNEKNKMLTAVTLHNLPEGMAVGVGLAAFTQGAVLSPIPALLLSIGISLQNFPEGAIISTPLHSIGLSKGKACLFGVLSGVVEPLGAVAAILLTGQIIALMPFVFAFAAGAMLYVVADELLPALSQGKGKAFGLFGFCIGFILMMSLDVLLG